jgi:GT2 family glycosyltransferase
VRVAVLSLTRDRLAYSQHCFATLHKNAGTPFDHYVLDQGSQDGTPIWLIEQDLAGLVLERENIGINRGMNQLLDKLQDGYDVIVKFDNDCELLQPNTLRDVASLVLSGNCFLSPRILGLNNPPPVWGEFTIDREAIMEIPQIGGIFLAVPAKVYETFRYNEAALLDDDVTICWWFRGQGGRCGYVKRLSANHYETTNGQHTRYPEYFQRTLAEGKPAL